ncbi:serine/threonine-protein phosphatase [Streptomyces sp. LP05-1]|uniref:Serine/threonine-protein phosphatase n=1 Tax=Streptomyces pyxinae TaxID=2970734 RepID=A0ABT2CGX3_9ACTN|nr:PP2C family protein-serine/threonine phosphatase [Streptomyces sp. LP05-1]MCS0636648.1 serine/threonine-protein phosphatase [Streptomyces sp. LP05-1]
MLEFERSLRAAPPHALLDVVRDRLVAAYGARGVDLLLADYGLTVLQSVQISGEPARAVSLFDSAEGRVFGSQEGQLQATRDGLAVDHHLPVTVRGERLGVLTVQLPAGGAADEPIPALKHVAEVLGHEILVAERDTDLYQRARRVARLTLAAEMQWQLLPGRACAQAGFELGAQLQPAYTVHGDHFDWAVDATSLTVTVTNGMHEGIEASMLTGLAVNALRNARRAGTGIADQAALADQALYAQHRGALYLSTLLLRFDLEQGTATAVDAGSPQLWRRRGRSVERVRLEPQLPLGMFEESDYRVQPVDLRPGDRVLVVSDGVYEAVSPIGEVYGERALARAIQSTSLLPAASVPGALLRELAAHRDSESPEDDSVVFCLDWHERAEVAAAV